MNSVIEKRRGVIINLIYCAMIVGIFYLVMKYAFWLIFPFLVALAVAMLLQRPVNYLTKKIKIPRGVLSTVFVLLMFSVLAGIVVLIGWKITDEIKGFIEYLKNLFADNSIVESIKTWLYETIKPLPDEIETVLKSYIDKISIQALMPAPDSTKTASSAGGGLISGIASILFSDTVLGSVKQIPTILTAVIITIVSCCFMTGDYKTVTTIIINQFSDESGKKLLRAKNLIVFSLGKIIKAYLLIILITTAELGIGLSILKLCKVYTGGYILGISLLVAIVDIVPVLGTGTILVPWAIYSFITGKIGMGIGLLIIYAVITIIRQVIEPKLVAGQFDMPPILTIAAMFIGVKLFGAIGIFLLPLTCIVLKLLADEGIITSIRTSAAIAKKKAAEAQKEQATSAPDGDTPAQPDDNTPAQPDGNTPSQPDGDTPAQPDGDTPAQPDGNTPA